MKTEVMADASALEPPRWPPRRWLYAIISVFLAQVVLIFLLSEPRHLPAHPPQFRTAINLAMDPSSEQSLAQMPALDDPTLSALPNLHGFSGGAWLISRPMEHETTPWTNSAHWLEIDVSRLGTAFLGYVGTNTAAPLLMADKSLPALPGLTVQSTNEPLAVRSEMRIEGDLASRRLLNLIPLRSWAYSDILTNTQVQLLVDEDGQTLPATLLASCGYLEADQYALKIASNSRFEPLPKTGRASSPVGHLTWGKMVFQWHTVPPAGTRTFSSRP